VYANRLNWARSYLSKAHLPEIPRRGFCRGTERARELLAEGIKEIDLAVLSRYPEFVAWREQQNPREHELYFESKESPEELIATNFEVLNAELAREIIERVHSFSPAFFERLIVDLLCRMGYSGGRMEMGRALGRAGDGGIDGVIKEDELGLDVVYVQAKRFAQEKSVPIREVRDFVGGLEGHRASKGVFVTTSYCDDVVLSLDSLRVHHPRLQSRRADRRPELGSLMIRRRVGVRVKGTYEVKRIDEDYFVE
jgi:restriction system protein